MTGGEVKEELGRELCKNTLYFMYTQHLTFSVSLGVPAENTSNVLRATSGGELHPLLYQARV